MGIAVTRPTTRTERQRRVSLALHNGAMEGVDVTPATRADAEEYIAGAITSDELVTRARARHGLR